MEDINDWSVDDVGAAVTVDGYDGAGALAFFVPGRACVFRSWPR